MALVGSGAWLPCGTWMLPGPGMEPMSLEPAGGFLSTPPSGKSDICSFTYPLLNIPVMFYSSKTSL